ncbi:hypothetical protein P4B35_08665 [Pontiellaceae bacterium B12227]|nr:hypothetical protein [Pontiellaceae bacterium B12227]
MRAEKQSKKLFELGMVVMTPGAASLLVACGIDTCDIIERHQSGDWGELYPDDCRVNDDAVRYGSQILSAYKFEEGQRLWIITEADRSVTTLLLPSEY